MDTVKRLLDAGAGIVVVEMVDGRLATSATANGGNEWSGGGNAALDGLQDAALDAVG